MAKRSRKPAAPGFVVLRQVGQERWESLGEAARRPGLTARAARSQAIHEASNETAKRGDVYAAVLRSEWRVALDWEPPTRS